uniref:Uncharacterized protein n=1 Tax=Arundo donax TaxID=35708 RepID=A0A0A8ZIR6_ARUDO
MKPLSSSSNSFLASRTIPFLHNQ